VTEWLVQRNALRQHSCTGH